MGISVIFYISIIFFFFIQKETAEARQLFWWLFAASWVFTLFIYLPLNSFIYHRDPASPALGLVFGFFLAIIAVVLVRFFISDAEFKVIIPFAALLVLALIEFIVDVVIIIKHWFKPG